MPAAVNSQDRQRIGALDGIRGIAIVLVVLDHGWTLWPTGGLSSVRPLGGVFFAGNLAVTVFFVVGAFVVTRGLLTQVAGASGLNPLRFYLRRFIRIGAQLYPLLFVVLVVSLFDGSDPNSATTTQHSLLAAGSYTWNWYLINNALASRSDLGHLWYLSVEQQFYIVLAVALLAFARFRWQFVATLVLLIAAVAVWRGHVLHVEGWWHASLRTTTRMDGLLLGVLAAMTVRYLGPLRRFAPQVLWITGLTMVGLVLSSSQQGSLDFLGVQGLVFDIAAALFVVAVVSTTVESDVLRFLSSRPLRVLGEASLAIYLWHYPLFWFIARHTHGWAWGARTVVAYSVLVVIVVACQLVIERPTKRWLSAHLQADAKRHRVRRARVPEADTATV